MTLTVFHCTVCAQTLFPARYFCPACGANAWTARPVARGTAMQTTVVHHRVGGAANAEVSLAAVLTDAGPVVIARTQGAVAAGDTVGLHVDDANRIVAYRI
ncbi:hypothetical protein PTE30175_00595 [Pandoraea terrae]|uniref:DUF35 domain-containing protein n=1 Tax=Pandoraea terrae TaxID=1537710 RepID=A0A5E4SAF7_9BURK|nr:zinc ribbon domain-containing protein [Pandoraea terrae]VVD71554.1 hypothetical protein PTE30175_00595 [Pandoraea terrae]